MPPISKERKTKEEILHEAINPVVDRGRTLYGDLVQHYLNRANADDVRKIENAMDTYMKECVLDAFSFLAKHSVECEVDMEGVERFCYKGEMITREQLFENFL